MGSVEFLRPEWFFAAILSLPVAALVFWEARFWRYFRTKNVREGQKSTPLVGLQAFFASLAIIAASILLADPRQPFTKQIERKEGTDVVFVLDVSKSMLAEDLMPNRIDVAKKVISEFVAKRDGDRFWLVVFAGKPFLFSPLTSDLEAFSTILSKVTTDSVRQEIPGFSGTNIGEGLLLASESLSGATGDKNVILVTDGEANVGVDPRPVAKLLQEKGVKVHSVGIGDPGGIDLFVTDKRTWEKHYFLWPDGKPIRAIVDAELMAFISTTTSGMFANARDQKGLETIFSALDQATKKESFIETEKRYSEIRFPFALLALVSIVLTALFSRLASDDPSILPVKPLKLAESSGNYRVSKFRRILRRACFLTACLAVLAGLFGFSYRIESGSESRNVMFVLDVSRSMDAVDPLEKTSRLDRAKSFVSWAVSKYPQNRHSLVVFSGEAFEAVPATEDARTFWYFLSGISSRYSQTVGTDLQNALRLVSRKLSETAFSPEGPKSLVVFLSDGGDREDTPEVPELRAIYAQSDKIAETLAITFGSPEGAVVPAGLDVFGSPVAVRDEKGNPVISRANPEASERLAKATLGAATNEKDAKTAFSKALSKVVTSNPQNGGVSPPAEKIEPFWIFALLSWFAAFAIQDKMPLWTKRPFLRAQ